MFCWLWSNTNSLQIQFHKIRTSLSFVKILHSCPAGLKMEWMDGLEPPNEVELGREYPIAYKVITDPQFYMDEIHAFPHDSRRYTIQ